MAEDLAPIPNGRADLDPIRGLGGHQRSQHLGEPLELVPGVCARLLQADGGLRQSRPVITATLSADHRVTDGHRGGLFLAAVDRLLQEPRQL
jgi:hypothetical protein